MNEIVRKKVQKVLGCPIIEVNRIENQTNNNVFTVITKNQKYIFKQYRDKNWPEDNKIQFVHKVLEENHISKSSLIQYCKQDEEFSNGWLLETLVPGVCASNISLNRKQEETLYSKLALLVSKVHKIQFEKYGYIGAGCPQYDSLCSFFEDTLDNKFDFLVEKNFYTKDEVEKMKSNILQILNEFDDLPSVLCHGDLSTKNVIIPQNSNLILIDWDDAIAYNWMADIARMTFWMRMNYQERDYMFLRKKFLEHYQTDYRKSDFSRFEKMYHLYNALDNLCFFISTGNKNMQRWIINYVEMIK